jgi:uncharacterized membrane protein
MHETPDAVSHNIETIVRLEEAALHQRTTRDRFADRVAAMVGTIAFAAFHVGWFGLWALVNSGVVPIVRPFDPFPFPLLTMLVSMEGVLLATFVLIKQNRMGARADRRAHLDLQINLLTEREVTRLLQVTERMAEQLGVEHGSVPAAELSRETKLEGVVQHLDTRLSRKN